MLELDKSGFDQTDIDIISVDIFDTVLLRTIVVAKAFSWNRTTTARIEVAATPLMRDIFRARNEVQALAYRRRDRAAEGIEARADLLSNPPPRLPAAAACCTRRA